MEWWRDGRFHAYVIVRSVSKEDDGETFFEVSDGGPDAHRVSIRDLRCFGSILASTRAPEPILRVRRLRPDAVLPRRMTPLASGLDLHAAFDGEIEIPSGGWASVGTGIAVAIAPGYEGQVRPRSGAACRDGITVLNAPGTIDADYRGEVRVLLVNHGRGGILIQPGDRIAQLAICPISPVDPVEVDELPETSRGAAGFGSTGVRSDGEADRRECGPTETLTREGLRAEIHALLKQKHDERGLRLLNVGGSERAGEHHWRFRISSEQIVEITMKVERP